MLLISFKRNIKSILLILMVLILSNLMQIFIANQYIGHLQKQEIDSSIIEKGIDNIESIVKDAPSRITQEQLERGFLYGMFISWIPWFLLGRYIYCNVGIYCFVVLISLVTYEPVWFTPIIFVLSFYLGTLTKKGQSSKTDDSDS